MLEQHSFQEVMRQWKRKCEHCDAKENVRCYVHGYTCSAFNKMKNYTNFQSVEEEIMAWAAEHPELVYPTWWEWLMEQGIIEPYASPNAPSYTASDGKVRYVKDSERVTLKAMRPIPADIAQKLGIEPKEVTYDNNH